MKPLSERLNPVLVKDVRQSLRGRLFRVLFAVNLSLAMVAAVITLAGLSDADVESSAGRVVFAVLHGIYVVCALIFVPMMANRGMSAERDDQSLDALVVSGLRTSQIVWGKWLAGCVMLGLFLSSSLPFLALGFTLYGLDVVVSLSMLLLTTAGGASLCLVAVLCASLARSRILDTMLLGLQLVLSVMLAWSWITFSSIWMSGMLSSTTAGEFMKVMGIWLAVLAGVSAWLFALTTSVLAHDEENASSRLRFTGLVVLEIGLLACCLWWVHDPSPDVYEWAGLLLMLVTLVHVQVVTEDDEIGRRLRLDLAAGRWRWPGAWLFLPGGGRGLALYLAEVAMVVALGIVPAVTGFTSTDRAFGGLFTVALVGVTYLALPSWLRSLRPGNRVQRLRWRILMVLLPFGAMLLVMLMGVLTGDKDLAAGRGALNPFWAVSEAYDGGATFGHDPSGSILYALLAFVSVALNVPRLLAGRRAVLAARGPRARRTRVRGHVA